MAGSLFSNGPILLWGDIHGVHCSLVLGATGPPFQISVLNGLTVLKRETFEHHTDAGAFAIGQYMAYRADPFGWESAPIGTSGDDDPGGPFAA